MYNSEELAKAEISYQLNFSGRITLNGVYSKF